jgi:hypothetical protein
VDGASSSLVLFCPLVCRMVVPKREASEGVLEPIDAVEPFVEGPGGCGVEVDLGRSSLPGRAPLLASPDKRSLAWLVARAEPCPPFWLNIERRGLALAPPSDGREGSVGWPDFPD